jgi:isoleucyl-tRNA synthetase
MATYGVDAVRWYFYTATPPGEPKNFDEAELGKTLRRVHLIVYNSFVFWKTYAAKVSGIKYQVLGESKNILDVWILARLDELIAAVTKRLDHYEVREAALEIESFIDDLSRWYIRRSRRRLQLGQRSFSEGGRPESTKDYEAASSTLGYALLTLVKLMAPFTPFFSEGLYRALDGGKESVHLDEWPKTSDKGQVTRGKELIAQMKMVRELAALGLAKRADAGIKVRQPLQSITYHVSGVTNKELIQILKDEVNVKEVLFGKMTKPKKPHTLKISVSDSVKVSEGLMKVKLDTAITPALREEGLIREISRAVQELRQKAGLAPNDRVVLMLRVGDELRDAVMKNEATLKSDVGAKLIEYKQSEKFTAEIITKIEGQELWIGIRKI